MNDLLYVFLIMFGIPAIPGIIVGLVFLIIKIVKKKKNRFSDYIIRNSQAIKDLQDVNSKYVFYSTEDCDECHTYDNETFYDNISCQDYLIYQLQFKQRIIKDTIKLIDKNFNMYSNYCKEVAKIDSFGNFPMLSHSNKKRALQLERLLFERYRAKPVCGFSLTVTLRCSTMYGRAYASKYSIFTEETVLDLIKRVNNRTGGFFNDRAIWDAICRVERGKVSNKMRFSIYERDNYRCQICGRRLPAEKLEIDHIKPIAKGGKSTYDNLQSLCKRCNQEKGDSYVE